MRNKVSKITLITLVIAIACASLLLVVSNAKISTIAGKESQADASANYTVIEDNEKLAEWLANPIWDAQLVANKKYEINIFNFSRVELAKKLEGNGATITMKSTADIDTTSINTDIGEYGLLFWKINANGALRNIKIINNVVVKLSLLQAHYWQGVTNPGQSAFYIGGIVGCIYEGGSIYNCELTNSGTMQVTNQVDRDGPTSTKQTYAFVSPLAGYCFGEISYCTVIEKGQILVNLTNTPERRSWHVWNTVVATFAGKLEGTNAKMVHNTVDVVDTTVYQAYGINEFKDGGFGNRISFYIGQYMSGATNGVLFKNIPAKTSTNFTHKSSKNDWAVEQSNIYTYSSYGRPNDVSRIYMTDNANTEGYNVCMGVEVQFTVIEAQYTPKFVVGNSDVIELDLTTKYMDTADTVAYSINGLTCYEQLSSGKVYAKKWKSDANGNDRLKIKDGYLKNSKIKVNTTQTRVYDGKEVTDYNNFVELQTLDNNGVVRETIASNKYKPVFNMDLVKDANEYILTGAKMVADTAIIAHNGADGSIWTTNRVNVENENGVFVVERRGLVFSTKPGTIYNATITLTAGLIDDEIIDLPINENTPIQFSHNGQQIQLDNINYTGTLGRGVEIGTNYILDAAITVNVTPHKITLPKDVSVIIKENGDMTHNGRVLNVNKVVKNIEIRALVKDYGYAYFDWKAKSRGSIVNNAITIDSNTNSAVSVILTNPGVVDTIEVNYKQKTFAFSASSADGLQGNILVKKNNAAVSPNFTGNFGDKIFVEAKPASNYLFSHWSNGTDNAVYSYSQEISFKLYQAYNLKANFVENIKENNAKLIYHDISGAILHEQTIKAGKNVAYYMGNNDSVVYPYEELYKRFREWKAEKEKNYVVKNGDEIKIYPIFFTTKTLEIQDNTNTIESGTYYFNQPIELKQGDYSINGFNISVPKNGLKFNVINNLVIDTVNTEQPAEQESGLVSQLVMENNSWYYIATVPAKKDYRVNGFTLHLENKTTTVNYDITIKRFIRYGDINNGYIYQFIVKIDRDLMAFIGNDASITLKSGNTVIGGLKNE